MLDFVLGMEPAWDSLSPSSSPPPLHLQTLSLKKEEKYQICLGKVSQLGEKWASLFILYGGVPCIFIILQNL